jgi:hypothetical protein
MEPTEIIKKNEKIFIKIRRTMQFLLVLVLVVMAVLQHNNIIRFFKWLINT